MAETRTDRWTHPATILVATDLSDLDRLMPHAYAMASETGARLLLMHVLQATATLTVDAVGMPYYDRESAVECAERMLKPWCEHARGLGVECEALIRDGHAAQQVISAARQFNADRLLLATRSRTKLGSLLLGSVARQVLRSVKLPVITVGPEAHLPVDDSNRQRTVLYATSLGETSRPSAALACHVAASQAAKLVLLHVLAPVDEKELKVPPTEMDAAAARELRRLAEETGEGCRTVVETKVVHGNPAIEILAEAAASHASLIVLGATQRSVFESLTRDRTVYRVLAHARCPVLTLREPDAKAEHVEAEAMAAQG